MPSFGQNQSARKAEYDRRVEAERNRRLTLGTDVELPGHGWVPLRGMETDRLAMQELRNTFDYIPGLPSIVFRDRENGMHTLTQAQINALIALGTPFALSVFQASFNIKDTLPIHTDVTDDALWPVRVTAP